MGQADLFRATQPRASVDAVPGLHLERDFITADDERSLLAVVDAQPWERDFKRSVQQYGLGYGGALSRFAKPEWLRPIPAWLHAIAQRIVDAGHLERFPENAVINSYEPGVGIGPHADYRAFGPAIACVSLASDVVIDFTLGDVKVPVLVPRRSLWVASGDARKKWLHAIAHRQTDVVDGIRTKRGRRVSITFRTKAGRPHAF